MFNVTLAHRETSRITFDLLSTVTIEKACVEWNFVINSEISFRENMLRQAISDKRDKSVNQDRKDDELDEHKYSLEDLPPYTPTVENHSNKLHYSSKTFSRSLTTLNRKRKSRERYKMNPLNEINSERINIPHRSIIGRQQYGKAKQFLDFSSIPSMSQDKNDVDPSNGFTQMVYESFEECSNIVDKETTSNKKSVLITPAKSKKIDFCWPLCTINSVLWFGN